MIEIKVPILPESINEATVAKWHKKPGEIVQVDDVIVEIETDKVVLEIPAEGAGVLTEITAQEGDTVTAQQALGLIDESSKIQNKKSVKYKSDSEQQLESKTAIPVANEQQPELKDSINNESQKNTAQASTIPTGNRIEERVPMSRIRKTIAKKLHSTKQDTAMLTTFNEIDASAIIAIREKYASIFNKKYGVKLGFMSFFVKASVYALKKFPTVNAYIDGDDIIYHGYCDVSIAVSSEQGGLVVPVLRDAHKMSTQDIEKRILNYVKRANENSLTLEEMTGGTFTISNGGVFGSLLSTPIINSPQSAILGMHKIQERAVVIDGEIVIRPMMYLALSYDHRIIDGKEAISFLNAIKDALEDPYRLLLKI